MRDIHAKFGMWNLRQSPDIGQNSDGGISNFRISCQFLIKENCHNSRTSDGIDMKLGPVTIFNKRNKATSKNVTMTLCRKIATSLSFFQFMVNLEQFRSQIPDAQSVKLMFSLIVTFFFLQKLKTEPLRKMLTSAELRGPWY